MRAGGDVRAGSCSAFRDGIATKETDELGLGERKNWMDGVLGPVLMDRSTGPAGRSPEISIISEKKSCLIRRSSRIRPASLVDLHRGPVP